MKTITTEPVDKKDDAVGRRGRLIISIVIAATVAGFAAEAVGNRTPQ